MFLGAKKYNAALWEMFRLYFISRIRNPWWQIFRWWVMWQGCYSNPILDLKSVKQPTVLLLKLEVATGFADELVSPEVWFPDARSSLKNEWNTQFVVICLVVCVWAAENQTFRLKRLFDPYIDEFLNHFNSKINLLMTSNNLQISKKYFVKMKFVSTQKPQPYYGYPHTTHSVHIGSDEAHPIRIFKKGNHGNCFVHF